MVPLARRAPSATVFLFFLTGALAAFCTSCCIFLAAGEERPRADWGLAGEGEGFARGVPLPTLGEVNQPTLEFGRGGGETARLGLMGREKFTPELSSLFSSGIVGRLSVLPARSTLVLRLALLGVLGLWVTLMRLGTSRLAARRCDFMTFFGMAGTGGASGAGDMALCLAPGEGDRNVRSVMDELLVVLTMLLLGFPPMTAPLATEDWEPLRTMRLVWIEPTGSGDDVRERRA